MTSKERFYAALRGESADQIPVFPLLMSFAAKRLGISYRVFASDGSALADAQMNIRQMFRVDAVTACSDAFRIAADLGGEIVFHEDTPPHLSQPRVQNEADFKSLKRPDPADKKTRMADRVLGVRNLARGVGADCMVLGWVDMPFAEACSLCGVGNFMMMLYDAPELAHGILGFLTDIVIDFALTQHAAGAPMIGAGDAAASLIAPPHYVEFALPYEQRVCEAVHNAGGLVKLHICGNTTNILAHMARSGADLFNVDHLVDLALAEKTFCGKCIKGNLNPVTDLLQATPEQASQRAIARMKSIERRRYMLSPGCEVPAGVTDDVFHAFCNVKI